MDNKVVYAWLNAGTPFYIGIGTVKRSQSNRSRNRHCSNKRVKAERENCFEIRILHENLSWKEACELEQLYISLYGRIDLGTGILTNMTHGGEGRFDYRHSVDTKNKMSLAHKGKRKKQSTKDKISKSLIGNKNKPQKEKIKKQKTKVDHYAKKAVTTPLGDFDSINDAAARHNVSLKTMRKRINNQRKEWFNFRIK